MLEKPVQNAADNGGEATMNEKRRGRKRREDRSSVAETTVAIRITLQEKENLETLVRIWQERWFQNAGTMTMATVIRKLIADEVANVRRQCEKPGQSLEVIEAPPIKQSEIEPIADTCDAIKAMLLEKNTLYGNSVLDPIRVFSKADSVEQIKVRIDDKLSRLARGSGVETEDVVLDLIGYLVLLRIAMQKDNAAR